LIQNVSKKSSLSVIVFISKNIVFIALLGSLQSLKKLNAI